MVQRANQRPTAESTPQAPNPTTNKKNKKPGREKGKQGRKQ